MQFDLKSFISTLDTDAIITIILAVIALISGVWLQILKKKRRNANDEQEAAYQKKLASEYREEWLKSQEENADS